MKMSYEEDKENHIMKAVSLKAAVNLVSGLTSAERKKMTVPLTDYITDVARIFEKYLKG